MNNKDLVTKNKILEAATQLIRDYGDEDKITVRDIAQKAGVGMGLVNYHFQTKENLIRQCVQKIVGNIIGGFDALEESIELEPVEKLKYLVRLNAKFLADNMGISRISIVGDLLSGNAADNSVQTNKAYLRMLKKMYGTRKTEEELTLLTLLLISSVQMVFLRHKVLKETNGFDFFNEPQRDALIDNIIEKLFFDLK